MKKLLIALSVLMVVGAGCVSLGKVSENKAVEGNWFLAFNLPSGWIMTVPYQEPTTQAVTPSQSVDRNNIEIFLQSTDKAILGGGVGANNDVPAESYVSTGYTQIRASRLDPRRVLPSEAEDLGNGFFRVKLCEEGEDCQIYGRYNYDYYLKTDDANYKFIIYGEDTKLAEDIIESAQVVTTNGTATE